MNSKARELRMPWLGRLGQQEMGRSPGEDLLTDWGSETNENQIRFLFVNHVNLEM